MSLLSQIGDIAKSPSLGIARQVGQLFFPREYKLLSDGKEVEIDTVLAEKHNSSLTLTKFAVENGADMSDHYIINPITFQLSGVISDISSNEFLGFAFTGLAKKGFDSLFGNDDESGTRSQLAWKQLKELQRSGDQISYQSNLELFENMMITSLSVSQTNDTSLSIFFDMTLEEVLVADLEVVEGMGRFSGSEGKGNPDTIKDMASKTDGGKLNGTIKDQTFLKSLF